jgi:O-Antigen ligase
VTSDLLRATARYIFFGALIVAPWMYGGTTATSIVVINWLLGASLLLWFVELAVSRRKPRFSLPLLLSAGALLAIGIWMTINARSIYDPEFGIFAGIDNLVSSAPGSVDYAISVAWMIRAALLIGAVLFVVDFSQDDKCLIQLWVVIAIAAGSISLVGLLQKATGAQAILWQTPIGYHYGSNFFATYYYHGNAGAFLNLVLPLTAGLAVRAFGIPSSPGVRAIWLTVFLLNLAALAANTSRMAQLIAVLIVFALVARLGPRLFRGQARSEKNVVLAGAAAILFAIFAIGTATHLEKPVRRWEQLGEQASQDARWPASRIALNVLPNAGIFGFGPGTFRAIFPAYIKTAERPVAGEWRFLHEDYLQTVMEWGWLGSVFWAVLLFGGMGAAIRNLQRQRRFRRSQRSDVSGQTGESTTQKTEVSGSRGANFTAGGREHFANRPREAGDSVLAKTERSQVASSQLPSPGSKLQEWSWRRRLILPLAVIALAGVALHAVVDFPLQIASIQLYVATYLGLCWGSARWNSATRS